MTAQIRFQEIGDDEAIAFLHNQLLSQADRRVEARGFRRGILVGLAAGGAVLAAVIAAFVLHPTSEQVYEMPGSTGPSRPPGTKALMLQPVEEAKTTAAPAELAASVGATSANRAAPPQLTAPPTRAEDPSEVAVQSAERPPASRPPATEASALLARGDALLGTGDITSARLFYERAADAGKRSGRVTAGGDLRATVFGPCRPRSSCRSGAGSFLVSSCSRPRRGRSRGSDHPPRPCICRTFKIGDPADDGSVGSENTIDVFLDKVLNSTERKILTKKTELTNTCFSFEPVLLSIAQLEWAKDDEKKGSDHPFGVFLATRRLHVEEPSRAAALARGRPNSRHYTWAELA